MAHYKLQKWEFVESHTQLSRIDNSMLLNQRPFSVYQSTKSPKKIAKYYYKVPIYTYLVKNDQNSWKEYEQRFD